MRLDLVVGPNGAGKTTFARLTLLPSLPPGTAFVNADEIARRLWGEAAEARAYEAARRAAVTRQELVRTRRPFVAETVFSHPSKLDLISDAQAHGYTVELHVLVVPEEVSVLRVRNRVAAGGHSVPEDKIRGRYRRLWALVAEAFRMADGAVAYDNSSNRRPRVIARAFSGMVLSADWPSWCPEELRDIAPDHSEPPY